MLIPNSVDVAVTVNYLEQGDNTILKPMLVVRTSQKMTAKQLIFNKKDYICSDPVHLSKKSIM